ncbi:hypothetical protein K227x_59460 [Rubripirellula lacrimiformis]|uniref:Uncharacterized protein n=1 Tax=Rubripirellula lacrimiformis TaxID=1930273 RepID=A0A517NK52_9BACT|nr:hypothetical protein [Rubripirellula lacrimiformis]QDT07518.1 hypothetical protein K227x_59460 [Rubripirellula lacrimiformis]
MAISHPSTSSDHFVDTDRLRQLVFQTPAAGSPWVAAPVQSSGTAIARADHADVVFDSPLFWYDPPWHSVPPATADVVARITANQGIAVSGMRRDFAAADDASTFLMGHYSGARDEGAPAGESADACRLRPLPRITPYRPERYGLSIDDFAGTSVIDVRLTIATDQSGRFAYSPEQIQRWEAADDDHPVAGGSWVPAGTFPPDVDSLDGLRSKLEQLRLLAPSAAVFVAMSPFRMDQELPGVIRQKPDGVILRADQVPMSGLMLAFMTRRARLWMEHEKVPEMPLWIVPGPISPDDAVKLVLLGATGVAIDDWCNPMLDGAAAAAGRSAAARLGYKSQSSQDDAIIQWVDSHLGDELDRFRGRMHAMMTLPPTERLVAIDPAWAKSLGVRNLAFGS